MFHLPLPFFAARSAVETVRLAEDRRNVRVPANIALASQETRPRDRVVFASDHAEVEAFLARERDRDLDYRMMKELCSF